MPKPASHALLWLAAVPFFLPAMVGSADEGMWLFDDLPREHLREKYGFEPSDDWARHVMLSSVRLSSGGSASFVSSNGLVLTNHHVAADTLYKLSTPENDYSANGFLATNPQQELKAPDLELNQLVSIEDVTERVNAAVADEMDATAANEARQAEKARIEKESLAATGLRSDVVTLYGGAKYHLYRYKKYTDVRLVWAPESDAAFFGGDNDNFEYPRYCLDVTLFRVYEDGQPAQIEHFLKWSADGADDGELVFVSGNPGSTQRDYTVAALKYVRDLALPDFLDWLCRMEIELQQFSNESPEHRRRALDDLFGIQNNRKRTLGMLEGLQNPDFIARKTTDEKKLLAALQQREGLAHFLTAWQEIEAAQQVKAELLNRSLYLKSRYFEIAKQLVLMAGEDEKPNEDRFREFRDSGRESLEHELYSPAPIYDDLEIAELAASLSLLAAKRGGDDPLVQVALANKSPRQRAAELIGRSQLNRVELRRELAAGGVEAIGNSRDPMIQFFRSLEEEYRQTREKQEETDEIQQQGYAKIKQSQIALEGPTGYPDATFTLRLAFGVVTGYEEDGQAIPPWTTMGGAFRHEAAHEAKKPWQLVDSWNRARGSFDESTKLNFVCTADIIGGNSGSPVINRAGEFVGIIFDGNIQSLTAAYSYNDEISRAVSVHSSGIREALRNIYGAEELADQLGE